MISRLPIQECNEWTYQYNQNNLKDSDRQELFLAIQRTTGMSVNNIRKNIPAICYCITFIFSVWFNNVEKDGIEFDDLLTYLWQLKAFDPFNGFWQKMRSKDILAEMLKDDIIRPYVFIDEDKDYTNRQDVYNKLLKKLDNFDGSIRVCFCTDDKYLNTKYEKDHDHALMVGRSDQGSIIMDTSYRSHDRPENKIENWITPENIRWWVSVE